MGRGCRLHAPEHVGYGGLSFGLRVASHKILSGVSGTIIGFPS